MEEQPSTTIQETPAATPAVETTPKAMEKPTPAATASPAMKATKSATSSTAKAASPAPAPTGKKMSVEAAIKDNENRWAMAHGKEGAATVEGLVADDFLGINSKGKMQNRRAMMAEMRKDKDTYTSGKNEKLEVHKYGNNVAVVVGKYREKGTDKDGKAFDRAYYFTDTWVERNGAWKCVASESMLAAK
jgi:ketosteroid isomerase-like protein